MTREKLPNRRPRTPIEFELGGHRFTGGAGHYPDGRIGEVFLSGNKPNSPRDIDVKDAAIAASLAIQFGCPPEVLRHAFLRDDDGKPAGVLGCLFDKLEEHRLGNMLRGWEPVPAPKPTFWGRFRQWVGA